MKTKKTHALSVIIPVYNEEKTILKVLKAVKSQSVKNLEIIVIDDASTDGTRTILKKNPALYSNLIERKQNGGKAAAVGDGFKAAKGDIIIIQDADLEYDPHEYSKVIQPIVEGRADVVYGSRFIGPGPHRVVYFWHYLGNQLLTFFSNMSTNLNLTDMETGCKAFRREFVRDLEIEESGFALEPELTAKCAAKKAIFYEVGIAYHGRTYEEGKKIQLKDFFHAIWVISKYAFKVRF